MVKNIIFWGIISFFGCGMVFAVNGTLLFEIINIKHGRRLMKSLHFVQDEYEALVVPASVVPRDTDPHSGRFETFRVGRRSDRFFIAIHHSQIPAGVNILQASSDFKLIDLKSVNILKNLSAAVEMLTDSKLGLLKSRCRSNRRPRWPLLIV